MRGGRKPRRSAAPVQDAAALDDSLAQDAATVESPEQQVLPIEAVPETVGEPGPAPAEDLLVSVPVAAEPEEADSAAQAESPSEVAPPVEPLFDAPQVQPPGPLEVDDPVVRLRMARIHLRTGAFALARSEFEALQAGELLEVDGQLDLAEVRWRTGEIRGAGEAAQTYLSAGGSEPLGFIISAEYNAYDGRHAEAQRMVAEALDRSINSVEAFFGGIRPRADWGFGRSGAVATPARPIATGPVVAQTIAPEAGAPTNQVTQAVVAETFFTEPVVEPPAEAVIEPTTEAVIEPPAEAAVEPVVEPPAEPVVEPFEPAVEPSAEAAVEPVVEPPAEPVVEPFEPAVEPAPMPWDDQIAAAEEALASNDALVAGLHLAMALRISPDAARAVLDTVGDSAALALDMVRAEATRILSEQTPAAPPATEPPAAVEDVEPAEAEPPMSRARVVDDLPKIDWGD